MEVENVEIIIIDNEEGLKDHGEEASAKNYRENKALKGENEEENSDQSSESSDSVKEVFQVHNKGWYQQIPCKNNVWCYRLWPSATQYPPPPLRHYLTRMYLSRARTLRLPVSKPIPTLINPTLWSAIR
jgi:hypothetical protein